MRYETPMTRISHRIHVTLGAARHFLVRFSKSLNWIIRLTVWITRSLIGQAPQGGSGGAQDYRFPFPAGMCGCFDMSHRVRQFAAVASAHKMCLQSFALLLD